MTVLRTSKSSLLKSLIEALRGCAIAATLALLLDATLGAAAANLPSFAVPADPLASSSLVSADRQRGAVVSYLRHIYSIYLGLRSCTEMGAQKQDNAYLPLISLEEARKRLRLIDTGVAEVGLDANRVWEQSAPLAEVTAEALKRDPANHLPHCQRMTSLFRMDADNLQVILQVLGAKTNVVPKDY